MSASFARKVISCKKKVKIHRVSRKERKGILAIVTQLETQNFNEVEKVRNTVKVVVLEGGTQIKDLLAILYHNSKPCYFFLLLSMKLNGINVGTISTATF